MVNSDLDAQLVVGSLLTYALVLESGFQNIQVGDGTTDKPINYAGGYIIKRKINQPTIVLYDLSTGTTYSNTYDGSWRGWHSSLSDSDLNVSTVDGSVKTTNDWTINFARAKKSGCAISLKIDATAKTASNGWIVVASGLPAAADDFFYQGYDDGHGAYKIKIDTSGNLSLSNRSGKVATYVDTVISYVAR